MITSCLSVLLWGLELQKLLCGFCWRAERQCTQLCFVGRRQYLCASGLCSYPKSKCDASFLKIPGMAISTWQRRVPMENLFPQLSQGWVPTQDFLSCGKPANPLGQICKGFELDECHKAGQSVCSELCECWTQAHLSWTHLQNQFYCWNFSCSFPQVNKWTCLANTKTIMFSPVKIRKQIPQFGGFCNDSCYI